MSDAKLAVKGGRRSIHMPYPPPWVRVTRALTLTKDVLTMIPRIARGKTTIGDGSKIIAKFEKQFKELTGAEHALTMSNGTATLHSAYFAVGVTFGHEVIVPSYTWHASATPVIQCGATPVFADMDPRTLCIDPDDIERKITSRTKAICAVHVWGNPCEMDRIVEIARRHDLAVVEDCSHAHGAVYKGKAVGTWGDVGCFSLNASKAVDAGEGGVAITDNPVLYDRMLALGHFGRIKRGYAADTFDFGDMSLGYKYRPHQCAMHLAVPSLARLPRLNRRCTAAWASLCDGLGDAPGVRPPLTLPGAERGGFQAFVLVYEGERQGGLSREQFVKAARKEGVPIVVDRYATNNFTYGMLHRAPLFSEVDRPALGGCCHDPTRPWSEIDRDVRLPVSERLCHQLVSMPRLDAAPPGYARACGRAIRKVLLATMPGAVPSPVRPGLAPA